MPDAVFAGEGFFGVLRAGAFLGRTFLPEEDRDGSDDVVILSHHIWQNQFGADPDIVGKVFEGMAAAAAEQG